MIEKTTKVKLYVSLGGAIVLSISRIIGYYMLNALEFGTNYDLTDIIVRFIIDLLILYLVITAYQKISEKK